MAKVANLVAVVGAKAGDAFECVPKDRVLLASDKLAPHLLHVGMLRTRGSYLRLIDLCITQL